MSTRQCDNCLKHYNAEIMLHCEDCGKCYCPECARRLGLCECAGDLTYFD